MKKSKSVSQQIVSVLKKSGTLRLADIRKALPDIKTNYISSSLWNLKKAGTVNHNIDSGEYTLTSVNKTQEQAAPIKAEPKVDDRRLQHAVFEANRWREEAQSKTMIAEKLNVQYEDALAVVRYLEDKLFKLIQINARQRT
jgi:DNA-binding HxlR family transcriptional regulator